MVETQRRLRRAVRAEAVEQPAAERLRAGDTRNTRVSGRAVEIGEEQHAAPGAATADERGLHPRRRGDVLTVQTERRHDGASARDERLHVRRVDVRMVEDEAVEDAVAKRL